MSAVRGFNVPLRTGVRRQIMRSQDRGKDKRGRAMSLCKQRLFFFFLYSLLLPSSAGAGAQLLPVQRKHLKSSPCVGTEKIQQL